MSSDLSDSLDDVRMHGTTYVVRVAVHRAALEPPSITEIRDIAPAAVIESVFSAVAQVSSVPPLALR
jgi:hypothetical protein